MKRKAKKHQIEIVPYENQNDVVSMRAFLAQYVFLLHHRQAELAPDI